MHDISIIQAQNAWAVLQTSFWMGTQSKAYAEAVNAGDAEAAAIYHPGRVLEAFDVERMSPAAWRVIYVYAARAAGLPIADFATKGSLMQYTPTNEEK